MRLLNTNTLKLEEGVKPGRRYAILSHRWTGEEVLYDDLKAGTGKHKTGFSKIAKSCQVAVQAGYNYIWIDTCCIDKSSSAELSEAINSMYAWYQNSAICYAYLEDVDDGPDAPTFSSQFRKSEWFQRGWTLQELLAPEQVYFFSKDWTFLGERLHLSEALESITGIEKAILNSRGASLSCISVAKRMSWISGRKTTRPEDITYCMLGIFDVNMALLYGEGPTKAFHRLQEEIIKVSRDQSIFAWDPRYQIRRSLPWTGILANHPAAFAGAGDVVPFNREDAPYSMTNNGLQIQLPILTSTPMGISLRNPSRANSDMPLIDAWAILSCHRESESSGPLAIALTKVSRDAQTFYRPNIAPITVSDVETSGAYPATIYIGRKAPTGAEYQSYVFSVDVYLKSGAIWRKPRGEVKIEGEPAANWNSALNVMTFYATVSYHVRGLLKIDMSQLTHKAGQELKFPTLYVLFQLRDHTSKIELLDRAPAQYYTPRFETETELDVHDGATIRASIESRTSFRENVYSVFLEFTDGYWS